MKRHVKSSFDAFVHLRNELPLSADGHRPVNERFRRMSDEMLLLTLTELRIPHHVIGGDMAARLNQIVGIFDLPTVMDVEQALAAAGQEYAATDVRIETARSHAATEAALA